MINRNDMLELTRRMTLSRNCFMRAAGVYIDENGYIDNTFNVTTLIISKKPGNTGISRDIRTEFTTDLLLSD